MATTDELLELVKRYERLADQLLQELGEAQRQVREGREVNRILRDIMEDTCGSVAKEVGCTTRSGDDLVSCVRVLRERAEAAEADVERLREQDQRHLDEFAAERQRYEERLSNTEPKEITKLRSRAAVLESERDEARAAANANKEHYALAYNRAEALEAQLREALAEAKAVAQALEAGAAEAEANAQLMLAAPEMLQALRLVTEMADAVGAVAGEVFGVESEPAVLARRNVELAKAAIAKAEGRGCEELSHGAVCARRKALAALDTGGSDEKVS